MENLQRFLRRSVFEYKTRFGALDWKAYILFTLITPVMQMLCFSVVSRYANGGRIEHWFIGNALVLTYMSTLFGVGSQFSNERRFGTLTLIIASPASKIATFLPRTIMYTFEGVLNIMVGFLFGYICFDLNISSSQFCSLFGLCFLASFAASGFGVTISSMALLTRDLNMLINVTSMVLLGLTGANFPLEQLPKFLKFIPELLPLTRSIKLSHYVLQGDVIMNHINLVFGEFAVGIVFMIIGFLSFKFIEKRAVCKGTLDLI